MLIVDDTYFILKRAVGLSILENEVEGTEPTGVRTILIALKVYTWIAQNLTLTIQ